MSLERFKLGWKYENWKNGIKLPFFWTPQTTPHLLIAGPTGGSKTVSAQLLVNQLLDAKKEIFIADYKSGGDWSDIVPKYAEFTSCDDLLNEFYSLFIESINTKCPHERYLIFDEVSSYMLCKDSKNFNLYMDKIGHIAFMGRSFQHHLIFISQQFSSKVISTAIREQFGIRIYMGSNISTESAMMLFPNCEIDKSLRLPKYSGYISLPEKDIDIIQMPYLDNPSKLKQLLQIKGSLS